MPNVKRNGGVPPRKRRRADRAEDASTAGRSTRLTTTAYAILGVLAIERRTAYELAREMRHCFEYFWPRDDKRVYADVRTLAAAGLVEAKYRWVGRRRQTHYSITSAGRRALELWLARPAAPVALEFEALIKVYLARFGNREQLLSTLAQVEADAAFMLGVGTTVRGVYLERCAPFQDEYVHVWAFVYDFLTSYFSMLHDWAARARAEVEAWSDLLPDDKRERALKRFSEEVAPPDTRFAPSTPPLPGMWRRYAD